MVFDQEKIIEELRFRGVSVLKGVLSSENCTNIIEQIEASDIMPTKIQRLAHERR